MFKLVVLSALLAVAAARPSLINSHPVLYSAPAATVAVQEPVLAKVGSVVQSIPTAVSHQSSTIVHSSAVAVQDIVAPAVRTSVVSAPAVVQSVAAAPAVHSSAVAVAPALSTGVVSAPAVVQSVAAAPAPHSTVVQQVAAAPLLAQAPLAHLSVPLTQLNAASPLAHTSTGLW